MSSLRSSIRRSLLRWVLAGSLPLVIVSTLVAAAVARRTSDRAFDQALYAVAADIASTVRVRNDDAVLSISAQSETFVRTDEIDQLYFCVRDMAGRAIGGDRDLPSGPLVRSNDASRTAYFRDRSVQTMTVQFDRNDLRFTVTVAETTRKRSALFQSTVTSLLVPLLLLLAVAVWVVAWAVRRGLQPLTVLEQEIAARSAADLSPIDESHIPQEATSLGIALNRMLGQVRDATERQRRFVADAAHQLRTPLASMQAQVDMMCVSPSPPQGMTRLSEALRRMVRLTHQLLALARAEPGARASLSSTAINLADVAQRQADDWYHRALARGIDLGFELDPAPARGDAAQLTELVANLVDNALLYTPSGGEITVSTGVGGSGDEPVRPGEETSAWLCVDDSGPGVDAAEAAQIFERFYRGRAVGQAPGHAEGSGLGLAIAQEIAGAHGATLSVLRSPQGGARFELRMRAV